jgi:transcriptional regulator with XRE-family HTH domain
MALMDPERARRQLEKIRNLVDRNKLNLAAFEAKLGLTWKELSQRVESVRLTAAHQRKLDELLGPDWSDLTLILATPEPGPPTGPAFADKVRDELRKRGQRLEDLANILEVSPSTVRSWVARNSFPAYAIEKVAKELNLGTEVQHVLDRYQTTLSRPRAASWQPVRQSPSPAGWSASRQEVSARRPENRWEASDLLQWFDAGFRRSQGRWSDQRNALAHLFSALGAGDGCFLLLSDALPIEAQPSGWSLMGPAMQTAVAQGARIVYLVPDTTALDLLEESRVAPLPGIEDFQRDIQTLHQRITRDTTEVGCRISALADVSIPEASGAVDMIEYSFSPFAVPGQRCAAFSYRAGATREIRLLTMANTVESNPDQPPLARLSQQTTNQFVRWLEVLIEREAARRQGPEWRRATLGLLWS